MTQENSHHEDDGHQQAGRAAANSVWLILSTLLSRALWGVLLIIIARSLGPEVQGRYTLLLTLISFAEYLSQLGLISLIIRNVGRAPERAQEQLTHGMLISGCASALSSAAMLSSVWYFGFDDKHGESFLYLAAFGCVAVMCGSLTNVVSAVINGLERMSIHAFWIVTARFSALVLGTAAVMLELGLPGLIASQVLVTGIHLSGLSVSARRLGLRFIAPVHLGNLWLLIKESLPFAAMAMASLFYVKFDTILLDRLGTGGAEEVAYYGNVFLILETLTYLPVNVSIAMLPMMSKAYVAARDSMWDQYRTALRMMALLGAPVVALCVGEGMEIVLLLFGEEYRPAGYIMPIMAVGSFVIFLNLPGLNVLKNTPVLKWLTGYNIFIAMVSAGLNYMMIPTWGYIGVAMVNWGTKYLDLLFYIGFLALVAGGSFGFIRTIWKPTIAGVAMGIVTWQFAAFPLFVSLPAGGLVYVVAVLMLGAITAEDRAFAGVVLGKARRRLGGA